MCGRSAEALIIAEQGGPDLFRRTKNAVINFSKDIFLKTTFLALLNGKTEEIVQSCELNKWKEALAILICHAGDNIGELALLLSSRLEDQNMLQPAYACMAVAGDFDRLVRAWLQQASTVIAQDRKKYASQVQYLFFKTSALAATIKRTDNKMLENIQYEYLQLLWSSGLYEETEEIIRKLPPMRHSMNLLVLIDRISRNANGNSRVPWTVVNVVPVSGGRRKTNEQSAPKTKETKHEAFPVPVSNKNSDFPKDLSKQTLSAPPAMSKNTVPPPPPRNQPFNEIKTSPFGNKSASTFPGSGEELPPHSNLAHDVQRIDVPPPPNVKQQIAPPMVRQTPPPLNMSNPVSHKEPEQMPRPPVFNQPHFDQQHAEPARPAVQVPIPHTVPPVRPPAPRATPGFKAPVKEIRAEGIDISGVPSQYHEIVMTWVKATQLPSIASTPRVLKDVEVKIQELVNKLKDLQFNDATLRLIEQMTSAFEAGDWKASLNAHLALTNTSWNENGNWLMAAKRLIQAAQAKQ